MSSLPESSFSLLPKPSSSLLPNSAQAVLVLAPSSSDACRSAPRPAPLPAPRPAASRPAHDVLFLVFHVPRDNLRPLSFSSALSEEIIIINQWATHLVSVTAGTCTTSTTLTPLPRNVPRIPSHYVPQQHHQRPHHPRPKIVTVASRFLATV